jgi:hypothetical protein
MQTSITQNGIELPIITETTLGRKGAAGKSFYTLDFAALINYTKDASGNKIEDTASTGDAIAKFFKGFESAFAFMQADFDRAMVSGQVTTPANSKTPKALSNDEKLAFLTSYVTTINELTRQRSGKASEIKRLTKEMTTFAATPANFALPDFATRLQAMAIKIAQLQAEADTASE